ncbi:hypothetical protein E2C01_025589 [Portunus trituberculatus]|uniref:Uncharacterized protein n=1 Tax=Portunus trituberculatus TaxID=210409 RepID=A0A5B7EDB2_PORTR|nr:hypothetical protein [Portunus trituberculatus]
MKLFLLSALTNHARTDKDLGHVLLNRHDRLLVGHCTASDHRTSNALSGWRLSGGRGRRILTLQGTKTLFISINSQISSCCKGGTAWRRPVRRCKVSERGGCVPALSQGEVLGRKCCVADV